MSEVARGGEPARRTRAGIAEEASKLLPALRGRVEECDRLRRLPDATREDLRRSGVARVLQPALYGGAEAHIGGMIDVLTTVGSACGSTAWCLAQYIGHNFMLAQWPEEAQEEVWGEDSQALLSGILIPSLGSARQVPGGYELTGQWPFVSGVPTCDWCLLSGMVERGDAPAEERYFVVRRTELEIVDTWDALGLLGSGSHDVRVSRHFIPTHRSLPIDHLKGGDTPGNARHRAILYQSPSYATFGLLISSASVGMADGLVEEYVEQARTRVALMSGKADVDETTQHVRISRATATVDAAKAVLYRNCDEIMRILESGRLPTDEERTKFRAAGTFAGNLAFEAANIVWDAIGGRGVYVRNPLSRYYRDLCTASRHMTHNWDLNGGSHGRVRLGLPLDNPSL